VYPAEKAAAGKADDSKLVLFDAVRFKLGR
jgi:hypothetical protein